MNTPPFNPAQASSKSNSPASFNLPGSQKDNDKPRLTEQQKKSNHITSEQNRRIFLRQQFDRLSEIIPGTEGKARSEAVVLEKLVEYGAAQIKEGQEMIHEIERMGGSVDSETRAKFFVEGRDAMPEDKEVEYTQGQIGYR